MVRVRLIELSGCVHFNEIGKDRQKFTFTSTGSVKRGVARRSFQVPHDYRVLMLKLTAQMECILILIYTSCRSLGTVGDNTPECRFVGAILRKLYLTMCNL